jgi:hypothetical protein
VEKEKRGGGANGTGELPNWRKMGESGKEQERGKRRGRWGVPALNGADGGEGEASTLLAEPIYRLARLVSQR